MKISHLALRGVLALPDLECDFVSAATGRPHDLIVISGPPASGKTRLVEALLAAFEAIGPYQGIVRASDWYRDPLRGARAELGIWLDEDERQQTKATEQLVRAVVSFDSNGIVVDADRGVRRLLSRYDHDPTHGKREYFPENRQRAWGARTDGLGTFEQCLLRSSRDSQKYSFVPTFLAELESEPTRARVFSDGLERLSPTVRYSPASRAAGATACFKNRGGDGVRYAELSSSEADAVLMAATVAMIGLGRSLAFLDRPERSVSPDRLIAWVHNLAGLGGDNQWFVASSDDRLASAVQPSQRISLAQSALQALSPASLPSRRTT